MTNRHLALAHLCRSIARAHHRAFAATDGEDPDWSEWSRRSPQFVSTRWVITDWRI